MEGGGVRTLQAYFVWSLSPASYHWATRHLGTGLQNKIVVIGGCKVTWYTRDLHHAAILRQRDQRLKQIIINLIWFDLIKVYKLYFQLYFGLKDSIK